MERKSAMKVNLVPALMADNLAQAKEKSDTKKGFLPSVFSNLGSYIAVLKRKAILAKRSTVYGAIWDVMQIVFSVLACALYIAETYSSSYSAAVVFNMIEIVITQFFLIDFLYNWFVATSTRLYLLSMMTIVDIMTIVPVFVSILLGDDGVPNISLLRFVRILRLIRILRTFKLLGGMSGIKRQVITLSLTLLSLTFMAAGVVQVVENDIKQLSYECKYIGQDTLFEPSCDRHAYTYDLDKCDCQEHSCRPAYINTDHPGEPSIIRCLELPYFNCFYFIVVTMATVGYGDVSPSTSISKMVIILFIVTSLIVIPMQVNELTLLLSMSSAYRRHYSPQAHENHVIICGYVNDGSKLERIFKEFFHPHRHVPSTPDFHLVILSPMEPTEEVRSLLVSPHFDGRVSYIIGSALSMTDLQRVRADIASAMFFVCNIEVQSEDAFFDDAATVLRTLSVSNFNSELECLVQVLCPEDRDIIKDSNVDVTICLDEYKTTIQARNAICPGLSTLVENMFHSFSQTRLAPPENATLYWLDEYTHGARMELYYIPLEKLLMESFQFEWNLLVEGIFVTYGRILIGVCNMESHTVVFNPGVVEIKKFHDAEEFFEHYDVGVILAHEQSEANTIAAGLTDQNTVDKLTARMLEVETDFSIRRMPDEEGITDSRNTGMSSLGKYSLTTQKLKIEKLFNEILIYSRIAPRAVGDVVEESPFMDEKVASMQDRRRVRHAVPASPSSTARARNSRTLFGENLHVLGALDIPDGLGKPSCQISNASALSGHIIMFGCVEYINLFVHELRRPLIRGENYRPIVIVSEYQPNKWAAIQSQHKDVYFLQEVFTASQGFNASNVRDAFAVILLASRDSVTMVEDENLDAETLFAYLKIERYIPRHVYFTVELTCSNNMAVLNSTIMRRTREISRTSQKHKSPEFTIGKNADTSPTSFSDCAEHVQIRGAFSSQRKVSNTRGASRSVFNRTLLSRGNNCSLKSSSSSSIVDEQKRLLKATKSFWDVMGGHHVLPVFAAGMSYVPATFDTLLVQSFFTSLSPVLCEKMVCGQNNQTMYQGKVPANFAGRTFMDVFRAFISRYVLVMGVYRSAVNAADAVLPYVYTSPLPDTILRDNDKLFLFGNPSVIAEAVAEFSTPFTRDDKGNLGIVSAITTHNISYSRKSLRDNIFDHSTHTIDEERGMSVKHREYMADEQSPESQA